MRVTRCLLVRWPHSPVFVFYFSSFLVDFVFLLVHIFLSLAHSSFLSLLLDARAVNGDDDDAGTLHNVISVGISAQKLCCFHFIRCCRFFSCERIRFDAVFVSAILL